MLVGQNGSGKSTVLQAIAAILGTATDRLSSPTQLDWPGFDLGLANETRARPISIEMDIEFSQGEIKATRDYFARTKMGQDQDKFPPGENSVVSLWYNPEQDRVETRTASEFFQFHGRRYASDFQDCSRGYELV